MDIPSEFVSIVEDFKAFLLNRKLAGNTFMPVSEASIEMMEKWVDKPPYPKSPAQNNGFACAGPLDARVFIIDSEGAFFDGEGGHLLVKILGAMNLEPADVFICNPSDIRSVHKKVKQISPRVIITLGSRGAQMLLNMNQPLESFRGEFHEYCGIKVMPTFHPSLLLQKPEFKRPVWEDMKQVMVHAGLGHGA